MRLSFHTYFLIFLLAVVAFAAVRMGMTIHKPQSGPLPDEFAQLFKAAEVYHPPQKPADLVLIDLEGARRAFAEEKGTWRLVNFWATWCPPCVEELPLLMELDEAMNNQRLDVVFISFDFPASAEDLKSKMAKASIPADLDSFYVEDLEAWDKLGIEGLPTSILYGPDGKARYKLVGNINWTGPESRRFFNSLLNQ